MYESLAWLLLLMSLIANVVLAVNVYMSCRNGEEDGIEYVTWEELLHGECAAALEIEAAKRAAAGQAEEELREASLEVKRLSAIRETLGGTGT